MEDVGERWKEFLEKWPVERIQSMTLPEYCGLGSTHDSNPSFTIWLERKVGLGSIRGGSAFKYGVYARRNKAPKNSDKDYTYGTEYAWLTRLGSSPEEALEKVRQCILDIIDAVRSGDLYKVEAIANKKVLWSVVVWKVAFIYQDVTAPQVFDIYIPEPFRFFLNEHGADKQDTDKLGMAALQRRAMQLRGDRSLSSFNSQIWDAWADSRKKENQKNDSKNTPTLSNARRALPSLPLNRILYGPPGTGKTWSTMFAALSILDPECPTDRETQKSRFKYFSEKGQVKFVTFHQSFGYEDFVEGIRATTEEHQIRYEVRDGVFKNLCTKARQDNDLPHVLIIDEINRGNVSRIFGELITLIEEGHRSPTPYGSTKGDSLEATLPCSGEQFSVPDNVYIIGTMNTADRSLTGLDIALRRRFSFEEMPPRAALLMDTPLEGFDYVSVGCILETMNKRIEVLLDRDHRLGHAYFMKLQGSKAQAKDLAPIFRNNILPLLQEYFLDHWEKIQLILAGTTDTGPHSFLKKTSTETDVFDGSERKFIHSDKMLWTIDEEAFEDIASYAAIVGVSTQGDSAPGDAKPVDTGADQ